MFLPDLQNGEGNVSNFVIRFVPTDSLSLLEAKALAAMVMTNFAYRTHSEEATEQLISKLTTLTTLNV